MKEDALHNMALKLNIESMIFLILDEVSTIDSCIIALLDYRLRQLTKCDESFGGLLVLFAGDFNQLGPVQKIFLPKDMMTWATRIKQFTVIPIPQEDSNIHDNS